ncbi:MAG: cobaltochelatase subunit CobT [Alphaproteobacteria bacterium]|nr:cobaltochelatase subunit CobT [Alphaproteobacteria bacterium]
MPTPSFIDIFKRATAVAVKAIGQRADLEIGFTDNHAMPPPQGLRLILSLPPDENKPPCARVRGQADTAALRLRYHDEDVHRANAPRKGKNFFDRLEQARYETLGMRLLRGTKQNIAALIDSEAAPFCSLAEIQKTPRREEALYLLALEKLNGLTLPKNAEKILALWRPSLEESAASFWPRLAAVAADQKAYAQEALALIEVLNLSPKEPEEKISSKGKALKEDDALPDEPQKTPPKDTPVAPPPQQEDRHDEMNEETGDSDTEGLSGRGDTAAEDRSPIVPLDAEGFVTTYRAFTTAFDETVEANALAHPAELTRLRAMLDRQIGPMQTLITRLANRLQRRLMARQMRHWEFDLEEGLLDAARLARVVVSPSHPLSYKHEKPADFKDTLVCLLLDNSGSMRGRPITLAAMSADILARTLERCGVKVEILGFTTRSWRGGRARDAWIEAGRPPLPGRLNELRHIVYKSADQPWRHAHKNLGLMLREGLLKENIDGEALLWAAKRLLGRPEQRKILMVLSDGAPVDDATLAANPANYLDRHLAAAIDWVEKRTDLELTAIGIGHDVTRLYRRAVMIADSEHLAPVMAEQLGALFDKE